MAADLELWLKPLHARIAGATAAVITGELRAALLDYFQKTAAWRETIGPVNIVAATALVTLTSADARADVHYVFDVYSLTSGCRVPLRPMYGREPGARQPAAPDSYYVYSLNQVELYPTPLVSVANALYADVALVPKRTADDLPDEAYNRHYDGILACALYKLYSMPGKPWTNYELAVAANREYRQRCMVARDAAERGNSVLDAPMRFPRWA